MNDRDAPEVDEISHLWSTVVVLPHVERLDDDDMDVQFPEYDGRCSLQTRQAIVKLGATGLELDTNWALTPRIWSCPPSGTSRRGRRMPLPGLRASRPRSTTRKHIRKRGDRCSTISTPAAHTASNRRSGRAEGYTQAYCQPIRRILIVSGTVAGVPVRLTIRPEQAVQTTGQRFPVVRT